MHSVVQLVLAQSRASSRADFFVSGSQFSSKCFGHVGDYRVSGVSYCGYHDSAPCSGSACCRSVGVTSVFVSRINCSLRFDVIACLWAKPFGYTSQEPLLAQGKSGLGEVLLRLMIWAVPLSGFGRPSARWAEHGGDGRES